MKGQETRGFQSEVKQLSSAPDDPFSLFHEEIFCVSLSLTPPMRRTSCVSVRYLTRTCTKVMANCAFVSLSIKTSAR